MARRGCQAQPRKPITWTAHAILQLRLVEVSTVVGSSCFCQRTCQPTQPSPAPSTHPATHPNPTPTGRQIIVAVPALLTLVTDAAWIAASYGMITQKAIAERYPRGYDSAYFKDGLADINAALGLMVFACIVAAVAIVANIVLSFTQCYTMDCFGRGRLVETVVDGALLLLWMASAAAVAAACSVANMSYAWLVSVPCVWIAMGLETALIIINALSTRTHGHSYAEAGSAAAAATLPVAEPAAKP